jgi:hypothetical protein
MGGGGGWFDTERDRLRRDWLGSKLIEKKESIFGVGCTCGCLSPPRDSIVKTPHVKDPTTKIPRQRPHVKSPHDKRPPEKPTEKIFRHIEGGALGKD